jgi:hypothetical protein
VTLLVTPDHAALLDLGQNKGTLHLSLRNPEDSQAAGTRPATLADLRFRQESPSEDANGGIGRAPLAGRAPPAVLQIRTLRGTHSGVVRVEPLE